MSNKQVKISKFLSYILRHNPDDIGIRLDKYGWANIDELIGKARKKGKNLDRPVVEKIVHESEKNRFTISSDGKYIRANYGHSIELEMTDDPEQPPDLLYHGTAEHNLPSIQNKGIRSGGRQFVHLSQAKTAARQVGQRHGKPTILTIQAGKMYEDGFLFYPTKSDIWLTRHVPTNYIDKG